MRVVGRTVLSPKHSVYLLEVGDRVLIVGTGAARAPSLLGELTDPVERDLLSTSRPSGPTVSGRSDQALPLAGSTAGWEATNERKADQAGPGCRCCRRAAGPRRRSTGRRASASPPPSASAGTGAVLANRPVPPITPDLLREGAGPAVKVADPSISAPAPSSHLLEPPEPTQVMSALRMAAPLLITLLPAAVLMFTAFVRINIVLILLRQALGSPQVPGNQVLTALALLLTALVMRPVAEVVYTNGPSSPTPRDDRPRPRPGRRARSRSRPS